MTNLVLEAFLRAAGQGPLVWVDEAAGQREVRGGLAPDDQARPDTAALFVIALHERFGMAASQVAERELDLPRGQHDALPSSTVFRAAACAESALALLAAQATMLQFEFSAELFGRQFTRLSWELGIDPRTLSLERRGAIDRAMSDCFLATEPPDAEATRHRLRQLLTQALH